MNFVNSSKFNLLTIVLLCRGNRGFGGRVEDIDGNLSGFSRVLRWVIELVMQMVHLSGFLRV